MSSSRKIAELSHSELFREFVRQQLAGDQSLERLQEVFAHELRVTVERFALILKDAEAIEAHEGRTTALYSEALDPATDWLALPNPRRVELILAVRQTHPLPYSWGNSEAFLSFSERVSAIIGSPLFWRLNKAAQKLGALHPLGYRCPLWLTYVNEVDEEERIHNRSRRAAMEEQDALVAGTDFKAYSWAYRFAHCDECITIGLHKLPEDRRLTVLALLKEQRDCDYSDYIERQEEMIRSYRGC